MKEIEKLHIKAEKDFNNIISIVERVDEMLKVSAGEDLSIIDLIYTKNQNILDAVYQRDNYYKLTNLFPNTLWASLFLTSYSLIAYFLNNLCSIFAEKYSITLKLHDLNGKGIIRSKLYLVKVMKFRIFEESTNWGDIKTSNAIRNILLHSNGLIDDDDKRHIEIKDIINNDKTLKLVDSHLILSKEFILNFLSSCAGIINELNTEYKNNSHKTLPDI